MIAYLRGKVIEYGDEWLLIETTGGIGYKVFATGKTIENIREQGAEVRLYTYLSVKEDGWSLFGFTKGEDKEVFELLLKVSGIGPKVALSILATLSLNQIERSIREENLVTLTQVPGIGKKTAQRIILELKEKMRGLSLEVGEPAVEKQDRANYEAVEVLLALGYSNLEASQAVGNVLEKDEEGQNKSTEEIIRSALRYLAP